jgi:hypothetical protein
MEFRRAIVAQPQGRSPCVDPLMRRIVSGRIIVVLTSLFASTGQALYGSGADLPAPGNNKVAYYVFDSGGPDHFPLTSFTDEANIVVLFEGKLWELVDSVHYSTGWMRNVNYHYYSEIIRDVRVLQARGIRVLMNVDDAASWSTSVPFTTYDGIKYDYQQFAAFMKACAIDSLHLDGISLDIEHGATGNAAYIALLKEIGRYFGPLSTNGTSQMYIAAIYSGGAPGYVIGKSRDVSAYFNFVMDMAYFNSNYVSRFNQWADSLGASKVMVGVVNDYFDLAYATAVAAWQPATPPKAGIMVYAANNLKSYTDAVFNALGASVGVALNPSPALPTAFALLQNYPNPFNPTTTIRYALPQRSQVTLTVYNTLGQKVAELVSGVIDAGYREVQFNASRLPSGVYFARLQVHALDSAIGRDFKSGAGEYTQTRALVLAR